MAHSSDRYHYVIYDPHQFPSSVDRLTPCLINMSLAFEIADILGQ